MILNKKSHHVLRLHIIGSVRFNDFDWEKSWRTIVIIDRWKDRLTFACFKGAVVVSVGVGFFLSFFLLVLDLLKLSNSVV